MMNIHTCYKVAPLKVHKVLQDPYLVHSSVCVLAESNSDYKQKFFISFMYEYCCMFQCIV